MTEVKDCAGCGGALLYAERLADRTRCHPCRVRMAVIERGARRLAEGEASRIVIGDVADQIERLERYGSWTVGDEVGVAP